MGAADFLCTFPRRYFSTIWLSTAPKMSFHAASTLLPSPRNPLALSVRGQLLLRRLAQDQQRHIVAADKQTGLTHLGLVHAVKLAVILHLRKPFLQQGGGVLGVALTLTFSTTAVLGFTALMELLSEAPLSIFDRSSPK